MLSMFVMMLPFAGDEVHRRGVGVRGLGSPATENDEEIPGCFVANPVWHAFLGDV
jgi:hypothetical protein